MPQIIQQFQEKEKVLREHQDTCGMVLVKLIMELLMKDYQEDLQEEELLQTQVVEEMIITPAVAVEEMEDMEV